MSCDIENDNIKKCKALIQDLMKHTKNRDWIKKRIKSLENIDNKSPKQEQELCFAYSTLTWIPFDKENIIRKQCQKCWYNKCQNQLLG